MIEAGAGTRNSPKFKWGAISISKSALAVFAEVSSLIGLLKAMICQWQKTYTLFLLN